MRQARRHGMSAPVRIQRKRTKGWTMPENTVYVGRPTRWGNPYAVGDIVHVGPPYSGRMTVVRDGHHAVSLFRSWMFHRQRSENLVTELRGKNLACWCPLVDAQGRPVPCHADVLLELANGGTT